MNEKAAWPTARAAWPGRAFRKRPQGEKPNLDRARKHLKPVDLARCEGKLTEKVGHMRSMARI